MKPAGRFDLYMWNAPQGAPIGRIVWPAPAGFNPGLDPKISSSGGARRSDLHRRGYTCRARPLAATVIHIPLSFSE
jgi:hypothetical protein